MCPLLSVFFLDDHGYLVTVSQSLGSIVRFHPDNLTRIDQPPSPIIPYSPYTVAQQNGAYYVGSYNYIYIIDCSNMTIIGNISASELSGTRDIIFLNSGQQMIVTSNSNNRLVFFNRSNTTSHNYDFVGYQNVTCSEPYGLFYVNDTFFYVTAWDRKTVYVLFEGRKCHFMGRNVHFQCVAADTSTRWPAYLT